MRKILIIGITLATFRFFIGAQYSFAALQTGVPISCSQTLSGVINPASEQDTYIFEATAGEAVIIAAVATSGTLQARAELYAPSGQLLATNGFGNTNTGSVSLPQTGSYTIIVQDYGNDGIGTYGINLQFTTGRCGTDIPCGQTSTRTITSIAQQDAFKFSATAAEAVIIAAAATSGTLAARAELYGPIGVLVTTNGFGNTNTGSASLSSTGVYTIIVRDYANDGTGTYDINLQFTTGRCGTLITCGKTSSGTITSIAHQDGYRYNARVSTFQRSRRQEHWGRVPNCTAHRGSCWRPMALGIRAQGSSR